MKRLSAIILEMLLQSHADEIELLPALAPQWPTGSVKGRRARGGFDVDVAWQDDRLTRATIRSRLGNPCVVRCGDRTRLLRMRKFDVCTLDDQLTVTQP